MLGNLFGCSLVAEKYADFTVKVKEDSCSLSSRYKFASELVSLYSPQPTLKMNAVSEKPSAALGSQSVIGSSHHLAQT